MDRNDDASSGSRGRAPERDPSVWAEPHLRARPLDLGAADALGDEPVRAGALQANAEGDRSAADSGPPEASVRDEPSLAWNPAATSGVAGYGALVDRRLAETRATTRLAVLLLLVLAGGPFGAFGAFWAILGGEGGLGTLAVAVTGPVVEEMTKVALILWVAERKPWLLPGAGAIVLTGFLTGAAFGAIENVVYLHAYFPERAAEIAPWRWLATAPMHAVASAIAAGGVARAWSATMRERRPLRLALAYPWIVAAVVLHGAFNAIAFIGSLLGFAP